MATNKEKLIAGAQKLVEKGHFDKAIKEFLKIVADDDSDVRVWLKIGDLYAKVGNKPHAVETYQRVAQYYSEQGFYLKAVAVYKQILKIDPRLVDVNRRLAELYQQLGLLSDAMQQYEAVAAFFHGEGRIRDALAALKQIVELDPETVAHRIKLAELYSKEQMPGEAIEEFTTAARQLREAGRVDDFMKVAERLLFHSPENKSLAKELAALYIDKGDPRRALPKLQVLFKANPRDIDVLGLLARSFEALDQRAKAVSVLKEQARILGESGDAHGRDEAYRKIVALQPGDPDAEAALARDKRPRRPSMVEVSDDLPVPRGPSASGRHAALRGDPQAPRVDGVDKAAARGEARPADRAEVTTRAAGPDVIDPVDLMEAAPAERSDEEEIAKILNECDVYIKYNLHAKAIEHLQRAFELNPRHLEAREKLKALYLTVGRIDEAVLELWSLYENADPGRARRYLREILEVEPSNARAAELLGERAAPAPEQAPNLLEEAIEVEELEDIPEDEFDIADPSSAGLDPRRAELRAQVDAHPPAPAALEVAAAAVVEEAPLVDSSGLELLEDELIPVVVEPEVEVAPAAEEREVEDRFGLEGDAPDTGVDRKALGALRAAEAAAAPVESSFEAPDEDTNVSTPPAARAEATAAFADGSAGEDVDVDVSDDLDEADFFIQQSLYEEARGILSALMEIYPGHPQVVAKLAELNALEGPVPGAVQDASDEESAPIDASSAIVEDLSVELSTEPLGGSQEMEPDLLAAEDSEAEPVLEVTRRGVIEKGVTAEDYETHYDLGIAYKEMGLLDEAISEFRLVMKSQEREVQCHLMIGLCFVEKQMQTDAIAQFKKALYVEGITERESLTLYFELGQAYERLDDPREALYYYEKVLKRDPRFRDVERHMEELRGERAPAAQGGAVPQAEDVDAAFDTLLEGDS